MITFTILYCGFKKDLTVIMLRGTKGTLVPKRLMLKLLLNNLKQTSLEPLIPAIDHNPTQSFDKRIIFKLRWNRKENDRILDSFKILGGCPRMPFPPNSSSYLKKLSSEY